MKKLVIGIVGPSAAVPQIELKLGVEKLEAAGFTVRVHPQTSFRHSFFAGTDEERARAFWEYAVDPAIDIVWLARGGYGAVRTLQYIERLARGRKPPRGKILAGYSDCFVLAHELPRKWGWKSLHCAMPGSREFLLLSRKEWEATIGLIRQETSGQAVSKEFFLNFAGRCPARAIEAPVMGGNLASWAAIVGTRYCPSASGKIVFLEDVTEPLYRLDRMIRQLLESGALNGAKSIVLGNFLQCGDAVLSVMARRPRRLADLKRLSKRDLKPLRPKLNGARTIIQIFHEVGEELVIPVALGLPSGHGPGHFPIGLGGRYRLDPDGSFRLLKW